MITKNHSINVSTIPKNILKSVLSRLFDNNQILVPTYQPICNIYIYLGIISYKYTDNRDRLSYRCKPRYSEQQTSTEFLKSKSLAINTNSHTLKTS